VHGIKGLVKTVSGVGWGGSSFFKPGEKGGQSQKWDPEKLSCFKYL
jgi:hypothetical protein